MPEINVALLGYKFMGKAHSNAYRQVGRFFPGKYQFRMKVLCGRDRKAVEEAARLFGWEEVETDWRKVMERKDIDVVIFQPLAICTIPWRWPPRKPGSILFARNLWVTLWPKPGKCSKRWKRQASSTC